MPRPKLDHETKMLVAEMYQRPMSFRAICDELKCSFYSAKAAVLEFGIEIRPKHVVLNNRMIGSNQSGANNGMWKGGPKPCPDCGGEKADHATRCSKCHFALMRTDANPNRLPPEQCKTDESKLWRKRLEYREWRNSVFSRDGYRCRVCNKNTRNLHPHHLDCFADFPEKRFEVDNGVTLCADHHKQFHSEFGYGNNTANQFFQFTMKHAIAA